MAFPRDLLQRLVPARSMRWFFAFKEDERTFKEHSELIKAAVCSAQKNTRLQPCFLYDGGENQLTAWLRKRGVTIIPVRSSLLEGVAALLEDHPKKEYLCAIAGGALLRLELARVMKDRAWKDEFILYTDCDVLFLRDVVEPLGRMRPTYFAAAPQTPKNDYTKMNSGVMLMNVPALMTENDGLFKFCAEDMNMVRVELDQGIYRRYFEGRWDKLPIEFNWKPYWGESAAACIVHFHGPKPYEAELPVSHFQTEYVRGLASGAYQHYSTIWRQMLEEANAPPGK